MALGARPRGRGSGSTRAASSGDYRLHLKGGSGRRAADAGGKLGGQLADRWYALVVEETADEGGADDHAVREPGHLSRLSAVADAQADRDRQVCVLADPFDQPGRVTA